MIGFKLNVIKVC